MGEPVRGPRRKIVRGSPRSRPSTYSWARGGPTDSRKPGFRTFVSPVVSFLSSLYPVSPHPLAVLPPDVSFTSLDLSYFGLASSARDTPPPPRILHGRASAGRRGPSAGRGRSVDDSAVAAQHKEIGDPGQLCLIIATSPQLSLPRTPVLDLLTSTLLGAPLLRVPLLSRFFPPPPPDPKRLLPGDLE